MNIEITYVITVLLLLLFSSYWFMTFSKFNKFLTIKYSLIFGLIESCFRYAMMNLFFTTHQQFVVSIFFFSIFLNIVNKTINKYIKYFIVYPSLIWAIEIAFHFYMKYVLYGYNPAWNYGDEYNFYTWFDGAIRLDYYPFWVLLGIFYDILTNLFY